MPSPRSRSPPRHRSRSRSRSRERERHKDRDGKHSRKGHGGFKWKEKKRGDDERDTRSEYRGYRDAERRDRPPRRRGDGEADEEDTYAAREARRDRERRERLRQDEEEDRRQRGEDSERREPREDHRRRDDRDRKRDEHRSTDKEPASFQPKGGAPVRDVFGDTAVQKEKSEKKKKKKAVQQEEYIIVNVNDRLGTKAAIPCLASDPVGLFKAQVAARIGRKPHEIMLKRQGERPFKDMLTLADYGVSNGVQLDLELDTGD